MFRRIPVLSAVLAGCLLMSLAGCSSTNLRLNFVPDDTTTYKASVQTIKDFKFEQPSLTPPKIDEQQSGTSVGVVFDQRIDSVAEDGSAVATITIKEVSYVVKDKDDVRFDFDSQREADKKKPFAKVIGQSYQIKISPDGSVETVDAKTARAAVTGGFQGEIAKAFFSDKRIASRHEILALPDLDKSVVREKGSWSRIASSPPGMLSQKSFEKVYTVTGIEGPKGNETATVEMVASESAEPAKDASSQMTGMGFFANMFDSQETYTGKLVLETGTGKIREYGEKLAAIYRAAEMPQGGDESKGPDTLTMGFTQEISVEIVE